ncbi:MAG: O-antigen ligase family protein, partial [Verrucomicrobia bacterium]|nr:O-antigen ligase family protein [Verrucomicrobiota bacterium]
FVVGLGATRHLPRVHWAAALLTLLLLAQGGGLACNAKQRFWPEVFAFTKVANLLPWLPGAVDSRIVQERMELVTGLVGAFWITGDLASHSRWRRRFWQALALNGVGLAALGLAQRLTGASGIFWGSPVDTEVTSFFATFRYHANAGAFLNLTLPFLVLKVVQVVRRPGFCARAESKNGWRAGSPSVESRFGACSSDLPRAFWLMGALITAAAGFVNISKAAMAIEVMLLGALAAYWLFGSRFSDGRHDRRGIAGAVLLIVLLACLVWALGFEDSSRRWEHFWDHLPSNSRLLVDQVIAGRVLPVSPWWGFGPGTFRIIFPFFTGPYGDRLAGIWEYAHQDYLQTLVEWGYVGGVLWAALLFGGWILGLTRHLHRARAWSKSTRLFSLACLYSLGGVALHATVDFPFQIASIALYAAVVLAFLWHLPQHGHTVTPRPQRHTASTADHGERKRGF